MMKKRNSTLVLISAVILILAGIFLFYPLLSQSNADKLYSQAEEFYSTADYNTAYDLYSQAREEYVRRGDDQKAREALLKMFTMTWITLEFPYNESEAEELIMENFPNVSQDRRESWLEEGYLQTLTSDGEKSYYENFIANILYLNLDLYEYLKAQNKSIFLDLGKDVVFRDYNNSKSEQRYTNPIKYSGNGILNISRSQLQGTGILKLWIPVPIETESQVDVAIISVTPEEYLKNSPSIEDNIGIAYLEVPLDELEEDLNITVQFTFTSFERHFTFDYTQVGDYDTESNLYKQYTKPFKNIEITPQIREKAQDIVGDEENPYLAAKKIYEYVVRNVTYNIVPHVSLSTLSTPESSYVHENLRGDCGAQSMYFCALCRAEGIPARACGGLQLFPELGGDHFWAEFYLPDYGWVPVDVTIAEAADWDYDATNGEREFWKEFYFGNLDAYRFVIQKDVDLPLDPMPEEPIVFSMVRQFPAAVCNTSVNDIGVIVLSNWEFRVKPIDDSATPADQTTVPLEGDPQADHTFWTVNDTMWVAQIESMDVSPDGKKVTYAVRRAVMTEEESKWHYQIYVVDSDGNNVFPLTQGEASSYHPKWSPDGQFIAFLSDRSGKTDIWMIPVSDGESVLLSDVKTGVANFRWSPDGEMISFLASDPVSYEVERAVAAKDDAMVVDQDIYVTGGPLSMNHLWTVSTAKNSTGQYGMRRLTEGNFSVFDWDWSPDGKAIVFSHASGSTLDVMLYSDISELDVETGDIKSLVGVEANNEYGPRYSPDGQWIVYCSATAGSLIEEVKVYLLPVGGGDPQPLAEMPSLFVESLSATGWSKDSDLIYFWVGNRTKAEIVALPTNGSAPRQVFEWDFISNLNLNDAGTMFGFTLEGTSTPPEAYVSEVDDFRPVQISNINQDLPLNLLGKTEVVVWNSSDGQEIEGLLTYPANYEAGEKYPLLLEVHGGPTGAYYQSFIGTNIFMNSQAPYSSQGYAVLRCNPRGSTGYGIEFMKGNFQEWGGMDYQDLMAGVDHIVEMGVTDPDRLGVMGWSYGGYMTAWIITHTDRFKAASVGAGPVDLVSYVGTMDSPDAISSYFGCRFWEDYGLYLSRSPIYHVKNVTTPTLIQHGAEDVRVPLTQGEELYSALKKRGIPVKMVVYPRSGHHINEPKLYRACLEDRLEWFNKYIPTTNE